MADITHYFVIQTPVDTVYKAVTEENGLASWWTERTVAKPAVGFVNEFKFYDGHHNEMKVTKLEPNKLVSWECVGGDSEWIGTNVRFDLAGDNGKTKVMFTHADWQEQSQFFANCNYHWAGFMKSLKDYCETGTGEPFRVK